MLISDEEKESIGNDLRLFYRKSKVEVSDTDPGTLFTIGSYRIRDSLGLECTVALLLREGRSDVLVDGDFPELDSYVDGREETVTVNGKKWLSVPKKFHRLSGKPAYWFVERNLTSFFLKQ